MTSDSDDTAPPPAPDAPASSTDGAAPADAVADAAAAHRLPRWRRILVGVLVVLGCLLVPISVLGVWIHNTLLNTDQWVSTVGPLVDEPAIQTAVANRLANAVIDNTDLEPKIADLLPSRAQRLAPTIAAAADEAVREASTRIVQSDQFASLWKNMNRRAHSRVVRVLTGNGTDTVETKDGEVVLQLQPLFDQLKKELDGRGISFFDDVQLPKSARAITIFQSDDLATAQGAVDALDTLSWVLPVLLIVVFGAAIVLSGNRRRTILRGALGVALSIGLLLIAFNVGRRIYLDSLPSSVNHAAAADVYDQVLTFLRTSARTIFVLAILIALGAWLSGPGRVAVWARSLTGRGLDHAHAGQSPLTEFVARNKVALRIVVLAIAGLVLVLMSAPSPWSVVIIAVLVLVAVAVIEVLGRAPTQVEDGTPPDEPSPPAATPDQPASTGA